MKPRKPKHTEAHPWVAAGVARIKWRKSIQRNIAQAIAAMRKGNA